MTKSPNILFIMTDDQAPWTLGAGGYPNTHTPELDRMAKDGVLFSNMFANAAVCSPSRASLITGRYPTEAGFGPDGRVHIADSERRIDTHLPTWPQILRDNGYRTALIGKTHLCHGSEVDLPEKLGYGKFAGWPQGGKRSKDPEIYVENRWEKFDGRYTPDVLADMTINTLKEWRDEPFAISLHFWAPHANVDFPEGYTPPHQDRTWLPMKNKDLAPWRQRQLDVPNPNFPNLDIERIKRMMREYYASVHSVDRNVGRVLRCLNELGLTDNTVVIFTSDQGYNMGHNGIWHKGNGRWITRDRRDPKGIYKDNRPNLYDNSIRVPCILRWPERIKPGTYLNLPVCFLDWFPTLLGISGVSTSCESKLHGRNLMPLLEGKQPTEWDSHVFAQHNRLRCCRVSEWKLICNWIPGQPNELYNLEDDPEEHNNLVEAADFPGTKEVYESLKSNVIDWMREINDPLYDDVFSKLK